MRPCQVFHTLENLRTQFSGLLYRKGVTLSGDDALTVLEVYQQWLALMMDLGYLHPGTFERTSRRLWSDMTKVDVLVLNNAFAECAHLVRVGSSNGFKAHCSSVSSHLFPLIEEDLRHALEGNVFASKRLIQLFSYTSRLSLQDIDLSQQLVEEYLSNEEAIPRVQKGPFLHSLNCIVKKWLGPYCPYEIVPQHGPGAVAGLGRANLYVKYKSLATDQLMHYAFGDPWWVVGPVRSLDRTSQTIFVPKSYKTFRVISMEPSTLMYFQQGVWQVIDKYVSRHPFLRSHIGFEDQSRNRMLARVGSLNRNYATLDLSHASDSVSYDLVKEVFKGTWLLRYLVVLRSQRTKLPDGRIVTLKKFAPMGSALCFPVETLVFAAICDHVTRGLGAPGNFSVFGDDIIVPTACASAVIRALQSLGFDVNTKKSFIDATCPFRESCGGEYIDGIDVTPMRVSRKYAHRVLSVRFQQLISLANEAHRRDFFNLRHLFIEKLRSLNVSPVFSSASMLSESSTNFHLQHRWNRNYQRMEVRGSAIRSKRIVLNPQRVDPATLNEAEEIRYRHWLEHTYLRDHLGMGYSSNVLGTTEYLTYQWFDVSDNCQEQAATLERLNQWMSD